MTPRGDVDGLILEDGTEVHFAPHLGLELVAAVRPGDAVTVHGLKARSIPLIMAMSVTADASNKTVVDQGPDGRGGPGMRERHHGRPGKREFGMRRGESLDAQGTVKMQLHGPRGEINGALLNDGTMIHLPPHEAVRLADQLKAGQTVAVKGFGSKTTLGTSIAVTALGPSPDKLTDLPRPPMPPHGGPGHEGPGGGPGGLGGIPGRFGGTPPAPPPSPAPAPAPAR